MNNAELRAKMGKAAREMGKVNALDDIIKIIVE